MPRFGAQRPKHAAPCPSLPHVGVSPPPTFKDTSASNLPKWVCHGGQRMNRSSAGCHHWQLSAHLCCPLRISLSVQAAQAGPILLPPGPLQQQQRQVCSTIFCLQPFFPVWSVACSASIWVGLGAAPWGCGQPHPCLTPCLNNEQDDAGGVQVGAAGGLEADADEDAFLSNLDLDAVEVCAPLWNAASCSPDMQYRLAHCRRLLHARGRPEA